MRLLTDEETGLVTGGKYANFAPVDNAQLTGAVDRARTLAKSKALALRALQRSGGKIEVPGYLVD